MATETIVDPISDEEPCGQDLDLEEDGAYLQFTSVTEALLPDSYMVEDEEGKRVPFYAAQRFQGLDLAGRVVAGQKLLERTHDLRLLATLAKLHLLDRSLARFESTVGRMAHLLEAFWKEVHPQSPAERSSAVERLTEPLLLAAFNHAVLFKSRRFGMVTWLSYLAATKGADDGGGTEPVDRILRDEVKADFTPVVEAQGLIVGLHGALQRIVAAFARNPSFEAPRLDRIITPVAAARAMLERVHPITDGASAEADTVSTAGADAGPEASGPTEGAPRTGTLPLLPSAEVAQAALGEAERFFASVEPSSPCLLLLRQAQALVGRSFYEAIQVLMPDSVDKAIFAFGSAPAFSLPLRQIAEGTGGAAAEDDRSTTARAAARLFNTVTSRGEALALLDQVSAFYRFVEPSSPIPLLVDRARTLAGKDFTALLKTILPEPPAASSSY